MALAAATVKYLSRRPTRRMAPFTEAWLYKLHRDIFAEFGRFPHRNAVLDRPNSNAEAAYLAADSPAFGQ